MGRILQHKFDFPQFSIIFLTIMKASKVYYMDLRARPGLSLLKKFRDLLTKAGIEKLFSSKELIGIKLHFGEYGNLTYLRPDYIKAVVDLLKNNNVVPYLTDANTLYSGRRSNGIEHLVLAAEHGFNLITTGAPVVIADGIRGMDYTEVEINLKHFKKIKVSSGIYHADGVVIFSHFKGHCEAGFGGAFKNLGMGAAPRPGKMEQHSLSKPSIDEEKCTGCQSCIKYCPVQAISLINKKKANIDENKCIGCGECMAVCQFGAVKVPWDSHGTSIMERIVEYAYGMWKEKKNKIFFINALIDISPDCDCWDYNDIPLVEDIGFLASTDPVAIEQASYDMVQKAEKIKSSQHYKAMQDKDSVFKGKTPDIEAKYILEYAEKIGMGTRKYEIVKA